MIMSLTDKEIYPIYVSLVGVLLLIVGVGMAIFGITNLTDMWVLQNLSLRNHSSAFDRWTNPSATSILNIYIFNVTNPEEVSRGFKPEFAEIGPYVYKRKTTKFDVQVAEKTFLSYRTNNTLQFLADASGNLSESDEMIVLNIPSIDVFFTRCKVMPNFEDSARGKPQILHSERRNMFIKTTVKNLLFDGISIKCPSEIIKDILIERKLKSQKLLNVRQEGSSYKFSYFHHKNGTAPETYVVDAGTLHLKKLTQIDSVDNSSALNVWKDFYCNLINGSDGEFFLKPLKKSRKLYVYENDICRSVFIEFEKVIEEKGVDVFRYVITENLLRSGSEEPRNQCFCRCPFDVKPGGDGLVKPGNASTVCLGNGLLSTFPCTGSSTVVSFPHFYLGDGELADYNGLSPSKSFHETYFDVEPNFGVTVTSYRRFQINMEVNKTNNVTSPSTEIFPILWSEEKTTISNETYNVLLRGLRHIKALKYGAYALMGLGVFLVATPYPIAVLKKKIFTKDKGIRKNNYQSRVFLDDEMRIHKRKTECESRWNRKMGDLDRVLLDGVKVKENSLKPLQIDNFMRDKH